MFKPILMHRKKNLLGSFFGKHANLTNHIVKGVGHFYDISGAGANFCIRVRVFKSGGEVYMDFTQAPTFGAAGTLGTLTVNGDPASHTFVIDRVEGNRAYLTVTPELISTDVVVYNYDPTLDGGITNSKDEQLCEQIDKPFDFISIIPVLGLFNIPDGYIGDVYSLDLNTINSGGLVASWALNGTLPSWATLDPVTGLITGTATEGAWSGYSVTATNIDGSDTSNTDSVAITLEPTAPVFSGVFDIVDGTEGDTVNYSVASLFANIPTSYTFTGGSPTGLSINNAGLITGTLQEGTWVGYAVTATNDLGSDTSNTDSITVASLAPVFSGVFDIVDGNVGDIVSYDVSGLFSNTPTSYSTNGAFPTGLSIDNAGLITGTLEEGTWVGYSVTATNSYGSDTSNTDSINVTISTGAAFVGPYRALTSVQGVNAEGDICNILPRGTTPATSLHDAPIYAPDYQGIYQEYGVDLPVWKGGRVDAGETYATDGVGGDLQPYAQCNEAATNYVYPSDDLSTGWTYGNGVFDSIVTSQEGKQVSKIVCNSTQNYSSLAGSKLIVMPANVPLQMECVMSITNDSMPYVLLYTTSLGVSTGVAVNVADLSYRGYSNYAEFEKVTVTRRGTDIHIAAIYPGAAQDGNGKITVGGGNAVDGRSCAVGDFVFASQVKVTDTIDSNIYIPTTTAAASIPKTQYTYPAANIPDPSNAVIGITLDYAGETDANVFDIGGLLTLKYVASQLTLSDGTNSVAVAITAGKRVIEITLTATDMTLDVDGVTNTGSYTPVASGLITVEEDHWGLNAK